MQTVFMTGAGGGMGFESFKAMLPDLGTLYHLIILVRDSEKNHKLFAPYEGTKGLTIRWGDLLNRDDVRACIEQSDIVLHIAAFVSPQADYFPKKAMQNNYGSTRNLIEAIRAAGKNDTCKFVYIGTVAETGDRMPPIHWGRVGDPIKPSMFDYYAVSKVAAERYVIESGLRYWVSLRQTGIIGPAMAKIRDAIQFHNCLDNVLEYASDRDSGRAMRNLCAFDAEGTLDQSLRSGLLRSIRSSIRRSTRRATSTGSIIWIRTSWNTICTSVRTVCSISMMHISKNSVRQSCSEKSSANFPAGRN